MVERKYWFKAHMYGYGWSPNTWQGWLTILLYLIAIVYSFVSINNHLNSVSTIVIDYLPRLFFFSAVLICITYIKGEPTSMYWSKKKKETNATSDNPQIKR